MRVRAVRGRKREDAKESITVGDKKFVIFKKDDTEHTQIQEVEL